MPDHPRYANRSAWLETNPAMRAWHLDSPAADHPVRITEQGLLLAGWVLPRRPVSVAFMVVRVGEGALALRHDLPFNEQRPDVIQYMLGAEPHGHPQLVCGFAGWIPAAPSPITLGVSLDGEVVWLGELRLEANLPAGADEPARQVLFGQDGWLFLHNDTNHSVDQHTGRLLLDDAQLVEWRNYFEQCRTLAAELGARHAIVIAAAKPQVLPEFYPHPRGALTVSDQVLALCEPADHVVASAVVLARQPDREACFIKTDTHWTDRGALRVTLALLKELGLDAAQAERHFAADKYFTIEFAGDLGSKLDPVQMAPTEFLLGPLPDAEAAFDSGLGNMGRLLRFENAQALWPLKLLLFGASSAYAMLKYLKRLFAQTVFVHSAGCVDPEFVRRERPDLLVMQTTARFLVVPPNLAFRVEHAPR